MAAVWGLIRGMWGVLSPIHLVSGGIGEGPDMQDVHVQCFPGADEAALTWVGLEKQSQSGLKPGDGKIQKLVFCTPPPSHLTHTSTARSSPQPPSSLRVRRGQQEWGGLENGVSLPSSACRGIPGAPSCVTMWPGALSPMETGWGLLQQSSPEFPASCPR